MKKIKLYNEDPNISEIFVYDDKVSAQVRWNRTLKLGFVSAVGVTVFFRTAYELGALLVSLFGR